MRPLPSNADQFGRLFYTQEYLTRGLIELFAAAAAAGANVYEIRAALHGCWVASTRGLTEQEVSQVAQAGFQLGVGVYSAAGDPV